jgi:hypothetical protein
MASKGSTVSSVNNSALRHISNSMRGYLFKITTFIEMTCFLGRKDIPHNHVDLCYMCNNVHLKKAKPIQRGCYIRTMTARVQKKNLVLSLKGLGTKTN